MSITSVSSSAAVATSSSSTSATSSFSSDDFLYLLVEQLQNQDPLNPTDTSEVMSQMVSYASFDQAAQSNETLSSIAAKLDGIASALDITV